MNATTIPVEIVAFAAAVRAALGDLPADEVEELTDGLEADMSEAYAEDLARELPDPGDYAAELRAAAGLPMPEQRPGRSRQVALALTTLGRDLERTLRMNPIAVGVLDFWVTLSPAWWIVRGWAAYQAFALTVLGVWRPDVVPQTVMQWIVLTVSVVGSVLIGLRAWPGWIRVLIAVGNVLAVVMTVGSLANLSTSDDLQTAWDEGQESFSIMDEGIWSNGGSVVNIFAYDAQGRPLSAVQLFDQDGSPLATSVSGGTGCLEAPDPDGNCAKPGAWVPAPLQTGGSAWNVFPMMLAESSVDDPWMPRPGAEPQASIPPFATAPMLLSAVPEASKKAPSSTKSP